LLAVVSEPTVLQLPDVRRWILTATPPSQAANPPAFTSPLAMMCLLSCNVTDREWSVLTTKSVELVAVPPGVVTVILPVVAPEGTVAVICVAETTVKVVAAMLLNLTALVVKPVPLKFVPVIVTVLPIGPKVGENEVIVGVGAVVTVKLVELTPVPLGVVTLIGPVVAPVGTVAVICVDELTVKVDAATLLNETPVAPVKFVPVITTDVPTTPDVGVNDVIVGAGPVPTVKFVALVAVLTGVVTWIGPVVAPEGTNALTCEALADELVTTANVAAVPLKSTAVAFSRFVPLIVTPVPTGPEVGVNDVIVAVHPPGLAIVKFDALVAVPSALSTWIGPVVAPAGTVTLICVLETTVKLGAFCPLKSTAVAAGVLKLFPVIVMRQFPAGPEVGVNDVIVGTAARAGAAVAIRINAVTTTPNPSRLPNCRFNMVM
jgi:hypothetical protein